MFFNTVYYYDSHNDTKITYLLNGVGFPMPLEVSFCPPQALCNPIGWQLGENMDETFMAIIISMILYALLTYLALCILLSLNRQDMQQRLIGN